MTRLYVFDTGALIAAERGKDRVTRFLRLAQTSAIRIVVPLAVVAEWWRGPSDAREEILCATQVVASIEIAKAAGIALGKTRRVDATKTVDAVVMATAAMLDAVVVTQDPSDFATLSAHFPKVVVLSV